MSRGIRRECKREQRRNMGFLTVILERSKILKMDAESNDETSEKTEQGTPEPAQDIPLSKLRDLRPEKDPIGAGRRRAPTGSRGLP